MPDPYYCERVLRIPWNREEPPVECDEEALPGSDFCPAHDPDFLMGAGQ